MKSLARIVLLVCVMTSVAFAGNDNNLYFKSGTIQPTENVGELNTLTINPTELVNGNYYRIIQFNEIPSNHTKELLAGQGIQLLNYLPKNAYYAQISAQASLEVLNQFNVRSVVMISSTTKLSPKLAVNKFEDWAVKGTNLLINGVYFNGLSKEAIRTQLASVGANVVLINDVNIARIEVPFTKLQELYALSSFYYFEQIDAPGEPENLVGATDHRSNNLLTAYNNGLKYDGTGVTVMLQDNSLLDNHIDYTGRYFNTNFSQTGDHGEHCGGTIAGAGNLDPTSRGMAPGADVIVYGPDNTNYNDVPTIYTNNGVRITSKSYSNGVNAGYTSLARQLDQQIRQMPDLVHVFSAGNSNGSGSTAAGSQWFNVTGGHKAGKNVITVANLDYVDVVAGSSSRGPCEDGRIKPDISAVGTNVWSTIDPNTYGFKTGTSMSCPGVSGTLAQLYNAYKDLNGNVDPESALIKAAVLNTGDDLGNPGPDFIHGWGRINARRAYEVIANNQYLDATISQGGNNVHNINVPANVDQVRIMVLWADYEGATSASPALVNDINMDVTDPNTTNFNPWVLNPAPNATTLNQPAVRGVDNLNNMEQVTIDNPTAGIHVVSVDGFAIPQGPQKYYLVYEFVVDEVVLTYPIGGEGFDPNYDETIRWDSYGASGTFTLEYSTNNGASWNTIASGINANARSYDWNVPNVVTGQALVRVTRGAMSSQSHQNFSIIGVPTGLSVNYACPDSMEVTWNAVAGATGYEVSLLGNKYMDSVGTATGATSLLIPAPSNVNHWWSVKALGPNNCEGRRANAVFQSAGTFNCILPIDAELTDLSPGDGFTLTSCMSGATGVTMNVTNMGQGSISNIPVHYIHNGGAPVNEVMAGPINVGQTVSYTFSAQISPTIGANTLLVWNDLSGDGNQYNDSLAASFTYANATAQSIPWSDDFESFSQCGTNADCDLTICTLGNDFYNEPNGSADDIDWRADRNGTPSTGTGPSVDFDPGTNVGIYLYTEASGGCTAQQANLISPCIDLTNATSAALNFAYHMSGTALGELHVDILVNGVWTNDITTVISGNQGTNWQQRNEPLTAYLGNVVNFRFRAITGNDWSSDIAIDAISVSGTVGTEEFNGNSSFTLYPNPAKDKLNVIGLPTNEAVTIKVYNSVGELVLEKATILSDRTELDINALSNGMYMVQLIAESGVQTKRFVKE